MSLAKPRILIPSGAGAPGFGGIIRCLKGDDFAYVVAGDTNQYAYGQSLADRFYVVPPSSDATKYLEKLKKIILSEQINVILPITTRELEVLASNQRLIESWGARVVVSKYEALVVANNKGQLREWAENHEIPVPCGGVAKDWNQFEKIALDLLSRNQKACFKPTLGNGSRGLGFICRDRDLSYTLNKPGEIWMTISEWKIRLEKSFIEGIELLLTEYLPGKEYSVDAFLHNHKVHFCIPRSRDKMVGGISVAGVIEKQDGLIELTQKLIEGLSLEGPIGVQWREDAQGNFKLLEINPRLQGTTSALLLAGINVPRKTVKHYLGMADNEAVEPKWGTRFSRYWEDVGISYYLREHYE